MLLTQNSNSSYYSIKSYQSDQLIINNIAYACSVILSRTELINDWPPQTFSELAITGYPPEDLLYREELYERIKAIFPSICEQAHGIDIVIGYPEKIDKRIYNRAALIQAGKIIATYDKQKLPNYGVFDEKR